MDDRRRRLLDLLKLQGCPCRQPGAPAERADRLREIAARAGGVNRLAVLVRFHESRHSRQQSRLDPSDN